jgi:hypothetical protein
MTKNDKFEFFSVDTAKPIGKYMQPKPNTNSTGKNGYPDTAKTSGIKIFGTGAATKGVMARGPMG